MSMNSDTPSPDDICTAILGMLNTLNLLDILEQAYQVAGQGQVVPFASNIARAVAAFDKPALRTELVRLLYAEDGRG